MRKPRPFKLTQPTIPESAIQEAVLQALLWDPRVAWAKRMNTGAGQLAHKDPKTGAIKLSQWIEFGFKGLSDILGQLKDGRLLAVETKSKSGRLSDDQREFLGAVRKANGVAFTARSVDDVHAGLDHWAPQTRRTR